MKKLLTLLLSFISLASYGQLNGSFKSIRSYNADSITIKAETVGLELMYDSVGVMYFNRQASPAKWRCYTPSLGWYDCFGSGGGGGGGGITTADNGLNLSTATNVQLGGPLVETLTQVTGDGATNSLYFGNYDAFDSTEFLHEFAVASQDFIDLISVDNGSTSELFLDPFGAALNSDVAVNLGADIEIQLISGGVMDFRAVDFKLQGLSAASPTTEFFRGDGTWAVPPGTGGLSLGDSTEIPFMNIAENDFRYDEQFVFKKLADGAYQLKIGDNVSMDRISLATGAGGQLQYTDFGVASTGFNAAGMINTANTDWFISNTGTATLTLQTASGNIRLFPGTTGDLIGTADDINWDATVGDMIINGQTTVQIASQTGAASLGSSAGNVNITGANGTVTVTGGDIILDSSDMIDIDPDGTGDVNILLNSGAGSYMIITGLPANCSGVPTGGLANVSGTLTVCP